MAAKGWGSSDPVAETLFEEPYRFDFFQAVRLLRQIGSDRAPVGSPSEPEDEAVRFRSEVSFSFPPSMVRAIERPTVPEDPPEMTVAFFGVASPNSFGSLPTWYAQLLRQHLGEKDTTLRDFFDIFNHRVLGLYFRAWERHRPDVGYELSDPRAGGSFERAILSLLGLGTLGVRNRQSFEDLGLLPWAGILAQGPVSALDLQDLVAGYFDVPTEIREFVPHAYSLENDEVCRLGETPLHLGANTLLGETVKVAQFKFRLVLGPLDGGQYRSFLPGGDAFAALSEIVRLVAGFEYDFEFQLVLKAEDAPGLTLESDRGHPPRLGWNTWIHQDPLRRDPADVVLTSASRVPESRAAATRPEAPLQEASLESES